MLCGYTERMDYTRRRLFVPNCLVSLVVQMGLIDLINKYVLPDNVLHHCADELKVNTSKTPFGR